MINKTLIAALLLATVACGGQGSKKSNAPLQAVEDDDSKVLGEEEDDKSSSLGSEDATPQDEEDSGAPGSDVEDKVSEAAKNLDLSKVEELIYSFKDGEDLKDIIVKFGDSGCSIATSAGILNGSVFECAALKAAILNLGSIPVKTDSSCEQALEKLIIKADGLEQALNTKTVPGCDIPVLPEASAGLLTEALKKLPI